MRPHSDSPEINKTGEHRELIQTHKYLTGTLKKSTYKSLRILTEPQITQDTRYDLPRRKIKDTGGDAQILTPKRLHKDSTHARTKRNDFPVGWAKLPPPTSDI